MGLGGGASYGRGRCGQSPAGTLTHLPWMIGGPFSLPRHRKKSSVTDSFSSLVHRPTMDQFTEGVASSRMSSQSCRPRAAQFQAWEGQEGAVVLPAPLRGRALAGTHVGQTWGLLRSGSQAMGEQTRLTSLMALPAKRLEIQEGKCCPKACVLGSSGQGARHCMCS